MIDIGILTYKIGMSCDGLAVSLRNGRLRVTAGLPIYARSEPNTRGHWSARHKRAAEQRAATGLMLNLARWAITETLNADPAKQSRLTVTLTRVRPIKPKARALDTDNLAASLKAVRDGVADAIGLDDGSPRLVWRYAQATAADYAVRVVITGGTSRERA